MHLRKFCTYLLTAAVVALLTACGGSGRESDSQQDGGNQASNTSQSAGFDELTEQRPREQQVVFFDSNSAPVEGTPEGVAVDVDSQNVTINLERDREFVYALLRHPRTDLKPSLESADLEGGLKFSQEVSPGNTAVGLISSPEGQLDAGSSVSIDYRSHSGERSYSQSGGISLEYSGDFPGLRKNTSSLTVEFVESLTGDGNNDHLVDFSDITVVIDNFGLTPSDQGYPEVSDHADDNVIDFSDITAVIDNFGNDIEGYRILQGSNNPPTSAAGTLDYNTPAGNSNNNLEAANKVSVTTSTDSAGRTLVSFPPPGGASDQQYRYIRVVPLRDISGSPLSSEASPVLDLFSFTPTMHLSQASPSLTPVNGAGSNNPGSQENPYQFDPNNDFPIQFRAWETEQENNEVTGDSDVHFALWPPFLAEGSSNGFGGSTKGALQGLDDVPFQAAAIIAFRGDPQQFSFDEQGGDPIPQNYDGVTQFIWITDSP